MSTNFNPAQQRAVNHFTGPALVLAGPGSGKTLVIVHRLKALIEKNKIPPDNILVVTFSKAAAAEMKERFEKLNLPISQEPVFGTFHSIFFKFLKAAYNYNSSNIISEKKKYDFLKCEVEKYYLEYDDEAALFRKIISEISKVKNSLIPPDKFSSSVLSTETFLQIFNSYNRMLSARKLIDFDDMLSLAYDLLKNEPEYLKIWQDKYKFILVDEFQDINKIQYETVKLLAGDAKNLFVVGDDDQSIYGFRGSRPGIMQSFQKDFPEAEKILLNVNYRSRKLILSKSQQLISVNTDRMDKKVKAFKENSLSGDCFVYSPKEIFSIRRFSTQAEQYETIINEILTMKDAGYNLSEIAILFRNNFDSSILAEKLAEKNVPFTVRESPQNIFDSFIALDLLSYIRLTSNKADCRADLIRVVNKPLRYISRASFNDDSLASLNTGKIITIPCKEYSQSSRVFLSDSSRANENSSLIYSKESPYSKPIKSRNFETCIQAMSKFYSEKPYMLLRVKVLESHVKFLSGLAPFPAIKYIRNAIGYDEYIKNYSEEKHVDLNELICTLDAIEESAKPFSTIDEWHDYIKKYSNELLELSKSRQSKGSDSSGVQLMTMHSSKGLEFDTVYIPNVNKETIPIRKAVSREEISEERRLFYVAMTRARDHLKISYVEEMRNRKIAPSEFLDNII